MDKSQFWSLIEQTRNENCERQAAKLKTLLLELETEEILGFNRIFDEFSDLSYRWDLWGAAYLIHGGASDDGFQYFRWWLIGQGREVFEAALQNPDSLAPLARDEEAECEAISYVIAEAYQEKTGQPFPIEPRNIPSEPAGQRWEDEDLDELLPELAAKFG